MPKSLLKLVLLLSIPFLFFPLPIKAKIEITEIMPYPEEGNEWVKLYNSGGSLTLENWFIDDKDGGSQPKPINIFLPANSYCFIELDNNIFNNSGSPKGSDLDQARLLDSEKKVVSETPFYPADPEKGLSWAKQNENQWAFGEPSKISEISPCPTLTPTPTPTPTTTPTPTQITPTATPSPTSTPTPKPPSATPTPFAVLTIKKPINQAGEELNNVKIYLDDTYLHCYAEEKLIFCQNCPCTNKSGQVYGNCYFGKHTLKLEKANYQDWLEEIEINPGEEKVIAARMIEAADEPSPTATLRPTPTPNPSPPEKPSPELDSNEASQSTYSLVLGFQTSSPSSQPTKKIQSDHQNNSSSVLGIILITIGASLIVSPFLLPDLIKKLKSFHN